MADLAPLDVTTDLQGALPSQFVGANFLAFCESLSLGGLQMLDDIVLLAQVCRDLDDAVGVQLDQIGQLLNQPRYGGAYPVGETDDLYRIKLRAAIMRNRSMGTTDDLIAMIVALLTGYSPSVQITDVPPAAFVVFVTVSAPLTAAIADVLVEFILAAKPAGVLVAGIGWGVDPTFAWAGFPDPPFAGYDDGTGLVGGFWANYVWP
jgi:hypothetical protein